MTIWAEINPIVFTLRANLCSNCRPWQSSTTTWRQQWGGPASSGHRFGVSSSPEAQRRVRGPAHHATATQSFGSCRYTRTDRPKRVLRYCSTASPAAVPERLPLVTRHWGRQSRRPRRTCPRHPRAIREPILANAPVVNGWLPSARRCPTAPPFTEEGAHTQHPIRRPARMHQNA